MGHTGRVLAGAGMLAVSVLMLAGCESPGEPEPAELPIVYVRLPENSIARSDLYLMSEDGRHVEQLTRLPGAVRFPRWSPDGRRIVFERIEYPETGYVPEPGLYTVGLSGTDTVRLAPALGSPRFPAWSPDGQRLAVTYRDDPSTRGIAVMNADGSGVRRVVTSDVAQVRPAWTPDGGRLLFGRRGAIWSVPAGGGEAVRLTEPTCAQIDPTVAPDGRHFAYLAGVCNDPNGRLIVADMDGANPRIVAEGRLRSLAWAANGRSIIYSVNEADQADLYMLELASGQVTRLTATTPQIELDPDWR